MSRCSSISVTGKEFRPLFEGFVKHALESGKQYAIDFIKKQIDAAHRSVEYRNAEREKYNTSFMVVSGLISKYPAIDIEAEKKNEIREILERFTENGNSDTPKPGIILDLSSKQAKELYYSFHGCDFTDEAIITLSLEQYRLLNRWEK